MSLKQRLSVDRALVAPGVYDALTASLAAAAGFEARATREQSWREPEPEPAAPG